MKFCVLQRNVCVHFPAYCIMSLFKPLLTNCVTMQIVYYLETFNCFHLYVQVRPTVFLLEISSQNFKSSTLFIDHIYPLKRTRRDLACGRASSAVL